MCDRDVVQSIVYIKACMENVLYSRPLASTCCWWGTTWIDVAAEPTTLTDSEQVLYMTTYLVFNACNPGLPLATMASTTLQGTLKANLQQGVIGQRPAYAA